MTTRNEYIIMYIMDVKTTLPISQARKRIFDIAKDVQRPGVFYTLTESGKAKAVIMSAEEFESWQETLEVMEEFPDLKKDADDAERDYKEGNYVTLEQILGREGFVLADKSKREYGISTRRSKKSSKRP